MDKSPGKQTAGQGSKSEFVDTGKAGCIHLELLITPSVLLDY